MARPRHETSEDPKGVRRLLVNIHKWQCIIDHRRHRFAIYGLNSSLFSGNSYFTWPRSSQREVLSAVIQRPYNISCKVICNARLITFPVVSVIFKWQSPSTCDLEERPSSWNHSSMPLDGIFWETNHTNTHEKQKQQQLNVQYVNWKARLFGSNYMLRECEF